jgi:hypothetical protein
MCMYIGYRINVQVQENKQPTTNKTKKLLNFVVNQYSKARVYFNCNALCIDKEIHRVLSTYTKIIK